MFPKQSLAIGINHHNPSRLNLKPCINDATDISVALKSIGFSALRAVDTDLFSMQRAIRQFLNSIRPGSVVFFYFSGHGAQHNGNNYLIPSDALGISAANIQSTSIDAQVLIDKMHKRKPRLVICVLDCCRTDASVDEIDAGDRRRGILPGLKAGLAPMRAPPATLIAFACAAGAAASAQGANNRNSLYTYHLLRYIKTPNMDIESVLKYVSADVEKETGNWQVPYRYSSCNEFINLVTGVARKGTGMLQRTSTHRHTAHDGRPHRIPYPHPMAYPIQKQLVGPWGVPARPRFIHRRPPSYPMKYPGSGAPVYPAYPSRRRF